ncbi:hypothetical protein [Glaciibacter superstes]|uniref:hypothetical protein n=1 Tax=Glaciibacter superstes TaxID=501023 RepID=UPI0003B5F676|nr:hypothetical protein [Glaciibacter superstes]
MSFAGSTRSDVHATGHLSAIKLDVRDITAALQADLGQALLSVIVGKEPRTVSRWLTGTKPPQATEQLLRNAYQVLQVIESVDAAPTARAWFMGMNPDLDDNSPAEALSEGQMRSVMAAARNYVIAS